MGKSDKKENDKLVSRVLIIDNTPDHSWSEELRIVQQSSYADHSVNITVLEGVDAELEGEPYNLVIVRGERNPDLFSRIESHSPDSDIYSFKHGEEDNNQIRRMIKRRSRVEEDTDRTGSSPDLEDITQAQLPRKPVHLTIAQRLGNIKVTPDYGIMEGEIDKVLGHYSTLEIEGLEALIVENPDLGVKIAATCKQAILVLRKENDVQRALDLLENASEIDADGHYYLPQLMSSAIMTAMNIGAQNEGPGTVLEKVLKASPPLIKGPRVKESLRQLEMASQQFNLEFGIRPSRSRVSVVRAGETPYYRREDPDRSSIEREVKTHNYFQRMQRYLTNGQELFNVPDVEGMVSAHNREAWVIYRHWIEGASILDEMRTLVKDLKTAYDTDSKEDIITARTAITNLLTNATRQCALVAAWGPMGLADEVKNPMTDYYEHRLDKRIVSGFNKLFEAALGKDAGITAEERAQLVDLSRPLHSRLAMLKPAYYKDMWFANSLIAIDAERGMMFYDFSSVRRLPPIIDLATLICYGGFVNRLSKRTDTAERNLVEGFWKEYAAAVDAYNNKCKSFSDNPNAFIREAVTHDRDTCGDEYYPHMDRVLSEVKKIDFKTKRAKRFKNLKDRIKRQSINVPLEYIDGLEVFLSNLTPKDPVQIPPERTGDYKSALMSFRTDFYAALFHRSLLLSSTACKYLVTQEPDAEKRYRWLSEAIGTLGNAKRAVRLYNQDKYAEGDLSKKQQEGLISFVESVMGKLVAIYRDKKI